MEQPTQEELKNMSPEQIMELQKKNCIFCKMIAGEIPTYKVYEDDKVFAILDINPGNDGHILLLPRDHYQILPQMPPDILGHMMVIAKKISNVMLSVLKVRGTSLYFEIGDAAGQKAPHVMLHIIPASADKKILQPESKEQDKDKISSLLNSLRAKTGYKVPGEKLKPAPVEKQVVQEKVEEKPKVPEERPEEKKESSIEKSKEDIDLDSIGNLF